MKRSPSPSSLSPETASNTPDPIDIKPLNLEAKTPLITPKKAGGVGSIKSAKTTATSAKSPKKKVKKEETTATGFDENGTWNAEKRALFMDTIIAAGYMAVDLKELANKLGMTPLQLRNQLQPGRHNFRAKAVEHIKGE